MDGASKSPTNSGEDPRGRTPNDAEDLSLESRESSSRKSKGSFTIPLQPLPDPTGGLAMRGKCPGSSGPRSPAPVLLSGNRVRAPRTTLPCSAAAKVQSAGLISFRAVRADSLMRRFSSLAFSVSAGTPPLAAGPMRWRASMTVCQKRGCDDCPPSPMRPRHRALLRG